MGGEKLAAGRGNLDPDPVFRRNERAPGPGQIGLVSHGEDELIDHSPNDDRIGLVTVNRIRIEGAIDNRRGRLRWRRGRGRGLPASGRESEKAGAGGQKSD